MTISEAIDILAQFNLWRRDESGMVNPLPDTKQVGTAIDTVVEHFRKPTKMITTQDVKRIVQIAGRLLDEKTANRVPLKAFPTEDAYYNEVLKRFITES